MKYLCLICADAMLEDMPPAAATAHMAEYAALIEETRRSGQLVGVNRLQPPCTAKTVRVRDGRLSVTDGPWIETKEQLGGYFLVDATDMDDALRIAARIPGAALGCVEVRPVADDLLTRDTLK